MRSLFLSLLLVCSVSVVSQTTYYVKETAAGLGNGSSWTNAAEDLQEIINGAVFGDTIFVAAGTYVPNRPANNLSVVDSLNRNNAFVLKNGVVVLGGFPGVGTPTLAERNGHENPTVLSGDIGVVNDSTDNCYHVVIVSNCGNGTLLDGFVICGGNANGSNSPTIMVNSNGISRNRGGGMFIVSSAGKFVNLVVRNNVASQYGGGICVRNSSTSIIANALIQNNTAGIEGGGVAVDDYPPTTSPLFVNATIVANWSNGSNSSGGVFTDANTTAMFINSIIWGNKYGSSNIDGDVFDNGTSTAFYYCLTRSAATTNVSMGGTNLFGDPMFADTLAGDYRLSPISPARNSGDASPLNTLGITTDLKGDPRPYGTRPDLGAFEYIVDIIPDANGIVYVNKNIKTGNGRGYNWYNAALEVADALKAAKKSNAITPDSISEIWVAEADYYPLYHAADDSAGIDGGRNNAFVMVKNVQLYGGFPANADDINNAPVGRSIADARNTRDWNFNPTYLSGQRDTANIYNTDTNCLHVVIAAGDAGNACVDGFTIIGGNADTVQNYFITVNGHSIYGNNGGGLYNHSTSLTLTNIYFTENKAAELGGGIYNDSSYSVLTEVTLINNEANRGGGIFNFSSSPVFTQGIMVNNKAEWGGGIYNLYSSPVLADLLFGENKAEMHGGGMYDSLSVAVLKNVHFSSNLAVTGNGAGIYAAASTDTLTDVEIRGNKALTGNGGGIYNNASPSLLTNIIIIGNEAEYGGGVYNNVSSPKLINILLAENEADTGGGMYNNASFPILINATIAHNTALTYGGGIYSSGGSSDTIRNSILWGNTANGSDNNIACYTGSNPTFAYSLVGGMPIGNGIILNSDPLFVDPATENYQLQPTSPVLHMGNPVYVNGVWRDLKGDLRIYGTNPDLGAYELQGAPLLIPDSNGIMFVNKNVATGNGTGDSWFNAAIELADALQEARSVNALKPDSIREIWVAEATYIPLYNADDGYTGLDGGRDNAFVLVKNVQIYGGFPTNANDTLNAPNAGFSPNPPLTITQARNTRNWNVYPAILSGDRGVPNDSTDNCYHVVISSGDVGNACLDGFTITKGNADTTTSIMVNSWIVYRSHGGGMNIYTSSPTLANLIISGNNAGYGNGNGNGGGMAIVASSPTLTNVTINGNRATDQGGGMYNLVSSPTLINVTLSGNYSDGDGGGIYNSASSPVIRNSIIWGNTALTNGNNVYRFSGTPTYAYSVVEGSSGGWAGFGTDVGNNLDADPQFVSPVAASLAPTTAGNYRLQLGSPAIDAGNNSFVTAATDLDANPRISGSTVDMGAYENQILPVPLNADRIMYVNKYVLTGNGSGDSWYNAMPELSDALLAAKTVAGTTDSIREIWVAEAEYIPLYNAEDGYTSLDGGRDNAFVMVKNVQIYGGFPTNADDTLNAPNAGFSPNPPLTVQQARETRDWNLYPTILSGDIGVPNDSTDNCYHVVISSGAVDSARLDGFTVTKGNANNGSYNSTIPVNGNGVRRDYGGGIFTYSSSPIFDNMTIYKNYASDGAGMCNNTGSSPIITNTDISENSSTRVLHGGGGILNYNSSSPTLSNVTISGNVASWLGGGIYNWNSCSPTLTNVTISGNTATNGGGGIFNENNSSPTLTNVTISDNHANYSGGMHSNMGSSPTLTNVIISGNSATANGGGISNDNSFSTFTNVIIIGNSSGGEGGGMRNGISSPTLTNVIISGNYSVGEGGGICNVINSSLRLTNVTISGNLSDASGGGIYNDGDDTLVIRNSIIWGNIGAGDNNVSNNGDSITYTYSIVEGSSGGWGTFGTDLGNNLDANPQFVNGIAPTWVNTPTTTGDYRLQANSPAIDAGNNSFVTVPTDLDGNPRIYNGTVDMGAYELQTLPAPPNADRIMYVNKYVLTGNGSGDSWYNAMPELSDALLAAKTVAGTTDSIREIWVAEATYIPLYSARDGYTNVNENQDNAFVLVKNVALYGGFPTNADDTLNAPHSGYPSHPSPLSLQDARNTRDWDLYPTILSGDRGTDSCYHVVISANDSTLAGSIDGFTITAGNTSTNNSSIFVNGVAIDRRHGGGMHNDNSSPTITNVIIRENYTNGGSGGGIYNVNYSSPTFTNVVISGNRANYMSGGMCNLANSSPTLVNVLISGNRALNANGGGGGGMSNGSTSSGSNNCFPTLINVTISGNRANNIGGGMWNEGNCYPNIYNSIIWGNNTSSNTFNNMAVGTNNPSISYSLIQRNDLNDALTTWDFTFTDGGNNMIDSPQFVNWITPTALNTPNTLGDYRLLSGSPAVDAGNNSFVTVPTDLDGNPRIYNGTVDMGAYELQQALPTVSFNISDTTICYGDTASIEFSFTGDAPWEVVYTTNNTTYDTIKSISINPFTWLVSPSDTTVYVFVSVTDNNGGTATIQDTVKVNIVKPSVNIVSNDTVCHGGTTSAVTFTGIATNYQWFANPLLDSIPSGLQTGNFGTYTVINTTSSAQTATINVIAYYVNGSLTCTATDTARFTITVLPSPTLTTIFQNDTVCHGDSTQQITFTGSFTSYSWESDNNLGGDVPTTLQTGSFGKYQGRNNSASPVTATITVHYQTNANGKICYGEDTNFTVTVFPNPSVSNVLPDTAYCHDDTTAAITFTSVGNATNYYWTSSPTVNQIPSTGTGNFGTYRVQNLSISPQTTLIRIVGSYANNGITCMAKDTAQFSIAVLQAPSISGDFSHDTLCHGDSTRLLSLAGYQWLSDSSLGGDIPTTTQMGNFGKYQVRNNTSAPVTATINVYNQYIYNGKVCDGTDTNFYITVFPNPTLTNTLADDTLCHGDTTVPVIFAGTATDYQWVSSPVINTIPSSQTGNFGAYAVENTTNAVRTTTVSIIPVYAENGKICAAKDTGEFSITVYPKPTLYTVLPNDTLCHGETTKPLLFTGIFTEYWWESDNDLGGDVPLGVQLDSNFGIYAAVNAAASPITATVNISYLYELNGKTCYGADTNFTITVFPHPTVDNVLDNDTLCHSNTTTPIYFTGNANLFQWESTPPIDSIPSGIQTGDFEAYTVENTTQSSLTTVVTITPLYVSGAKTCIGADTSFTITVDPMPAVEYIPADMVLCSGTQTGLVVFGSDQYDWEANGDPINGLPAGTQQNDFGDYLLENQTDKVQTAVVTVKPISANGANCPVKEDSFSVTVLPEPTLDNILQDDSLCDGETTTPIKFDGIGTSFSWKMIGTVSNIPANGTDEFGAYIVANKSSTPQISTITVTPKYTWQGVECESADQSFDIIVNPTTAISSITSNASALCEDDELKIEIDVAGGDLVYQWYRNDTLLIGERNKDYIVNQVSNIHKGTYYVEVYGACGDAKSKSVNLDIRSDKMLVEKWHDVILVDNSGFEYIGYQWYKDGRIINGATEQFYQEIGGLNGCYSVELRLKVGGRMRSCERCAYKTAKSGDVSLYPNPTQQGKSVTVTLDPEEASQTIETIELFAPSGQQIAIAQVQNTTHEIETANLASGVYILKITTSDKRVYNKKVVVF